MLMSEVELSYEFDYESNATVTRIRIGRLIKESRFAFRVCENPRLAMARVIETLVRDLQDIQRAEEERCRELE